MTEIEITLDDLDLEDLPSTWKGRMEAIVNGAVDFDDIEPLVVFCTHTADKAIANNKGALLVSPTHGPSWSWWCEKNINDLLAYVGGVPSDFQKTLFKELVACGETADQVELPSA